jgi:hypothetical protein
MHLFATRITRSQRQTDAFGFFYSTKCREFLLIILVIILIILILLLLLLLLLLIIIVTKEGLCNCLFTAFTSLFTAYSLPIHCLFTAYSLPIHGSKKGVSSLQLKLVMWRTVLNAVSCVHVKCKVTLDTFRRLYMNEDTGKLCTSCTLEVSRQHLTGSHPHDSCFDSESASAGSNQTVCLQAPENSRFCPQCGTSLVRNSGYPLGA